jgi:hypothetical protein
MRQNSVINNLLYLVLLFSAIELLPGCNRSNKNKIIDSQKNAPVTVNLSKPPSSFTDTLVITSLSAIFYNPDSLQLEKIKGILKKNEFESLTHEYFYQMRNARMELKEYWPQIKIVESTKARFLLFIKADKTKELVDLNTYQEFSGMILYDPSKEPAPIDMMNMGTEVANYLKR